MRGQNSKDKLNIDGEEEQEVRSQTHQSKLKLQSPASYQLPQNVIMWHFRNTLAARVLGDERAMKYFIVTSGAPWKVALNIVLALAAISLGLVGVMLREAKWLVTFNLVHLLALAVFTFFRADLIIARRLVVRLRFFVDFVLAIIFNIAMITVVQGDIRIIYFIWLQIIIAWFDIVESYPKFVLRKLRRPFAVYGCCVMFVFSAVLSLGVVPDIKEIDVGMGNLGGLATSNISLTNTNIAINTSFSLFFFFLSDSYHAIAHPNVMLRLFLPIYPVDDPSDVLRVPEFMRGPKEKIAVLAIRDEEELRREIEEQDKDDAAMEGRGG